MKSGNIRIRFIPLMQSILKRSKFYDYISLNRAEWVARQAASLPAGSVILDAGAGSCQYKNLFSHCEYKAQDFARLQGDQIRDGEYGKIDYICDVADIPVPNASFDAILCTEVIEHVPHPARVIREFFRILRPSGKLLLTAPLGSGIHQEPYHFYGGFTPYWYQQFLADAGFESIRVYPNAGFFKMYAWESLRFIRLSNPHSLRAPLWVRLLWAPLWLCALPFLVVLVPLVCHYLDTYDKERRFTAGYHVLATKGAAAAPS